MSKNGSQPTVLMHVDQSLTLWAFLDVYGSTQKIRMLDCSIVEQSRPVCVSPVPIIPSGSRLEGRSLRVTLPEARCSSNAEVVQLDTGVGGGTVLVVNLPPVNPTPPSSSATLLSTYSHTYIEVSYIYIFVEMKYIRKNYILQ